MGAVNILSVYPNEGRRRGGLGGGDESVAVIWTLNQNQNLVCHDEVPDQEKCPLIVKLILQLVFCTQIARGERTTSKS